jgi:hypothetical protein
VHDYTVLVGGVTCSCLLSVSIHQVSQEQIVIARSDGLARLSDPIDVAMGRLRRNPDATS